MGTFEQQITELANAGRRMQDAFAALKSCEQATADMAAVRGGGITAEGWLLYHRCWREVVAAREAFVAIEPPLGIEISLAVMPTSGNLSHSGDVAPPVLASPARAFPGSGDPGDPGLGRPSTVETDGPAGPSEG